MLVSDGGTNQTVAGFGCVIATNTGTVFSECNGPVGGYEPSSFRAKAEGMLQNVRAAQTLRTNNFTGSFIFVTGSESLIKVLQRIMNRDFFLLKRNMNEYDIIAPLSKIL